jgi:hypothetical protein
MNRSAVMKPDTVDFYGAAKGSFIDHAKHQDTSIDPDIAGNTLILDGLLVIDCGCFATI